MLFDIKTLEETSIAAADVLRLCAFLDSLAIPEELLYEGAPLLGIADAHEAIALLQQSNALLHDSEMRTFSLPPALSSELLAEITWEYQRLWVEGVVRVVQAALPDAARQDTWERYERYLPQVRACATLIERYELFTQEGMQLLSRTASYLAERARPSEAEPLYLRALALQERLLGEKHPQTIMTYTALAQLYHLQKKPVQAESFYWHLLKIREQLSGHQHPETARALCNLAAFYRSQGRYERAEPLYERALAIYERGGAAQYAGILTCLNSLATLHRSLRHYKQALPLFQRILSLQEHYLGQQHPETAEALENLAVLCQRMDNHKQALPLLQRAAAIYEYSLGSTHAKSVAALENYALQLIQLKRDQEAKSVLARIAELRKKESGKDI